jgi:hypothetical protein
VPDDGQHSGAEGSRTLEFALRTRQPIIANETGKAVTPTPESVCTNVFTSEVENANDMAAVDADLTMLIARWPTLSAQTKAYILAIVREAGT